MTVGSPSPHQHFVRRTQTDADPSQHSPTGIYCILGLYAKAIILYTMLSQLVDLYIGLGI